jgi:hypothetical protein
VKYNARPECTGIRGGLEPKARGGESAGKPNRAADPRQAKAGCNVADIQMLKRAFDGMITEVIPQTRNRLRMRIALFQVLDFWDEDRRAIAELRQRVEQLEAEVKRLGGRS